MLFLVMFTSAAWASRTPAILAGEPLCELYISLDLKGNLLRGTATIKDAYGLTVSTAGLRVISLTLNGEAFKPETDTFVVKGEGALEIKYEAVFPWAFGKGPETGRSIESPAPGNLVSEDGVSLTEGWHPEMDRPVVFGLKALVPEGFVAVSEAEAVAMSETAGGRLYSFYFPYPRRGVNFVSGRYMEFSEGEVHAYFFPEDASLSGIYIERAKEYLRRYGALLGPYPYKRFSIVEGVLPTGISMPTFTLIGRDVVRLPFIPETALGHEVIHQWFGNHVYVNSSEGNWSEGLTTYLEGLRAPAQEVADPAKRKKWLADYQSYVNSSNEIALRDFRGRVDFATRAVGYEKAAMVFHMLKAEVGEEVFYKALKEFILRWKFKEAGWKDIETAFERESGNDLGWFFAQWVEQKGVPGLDVRLKSVYIKEGQPTVSFEIIQKSPPYRLKVPVGVITTSGEIDRVLQVETERQAFEIKTGESSAEVGGSPLELVLDPDYDLMRSLAEKEFPPVVARLGGDEGRLAIYPAAQAALYQSLLDALKAEGFALKKAEDASEADIQKASVVLIDYENPFFKRLFAGATGPGDIGVADLLRGGSQPQYRGGSQPQYRGGSQPPGFTFKVMENPLNRAKVVALAHGRSKEEVDAVGRKVFRYGEYSELRFEAGRNTLKETALSEEGVKRVVYKVPAGWPGWGGVSSDGKAMGLYEVIAAVAEKPVIYVGEAHTSAEHHKVQLEVVMELKRRASKFAIGMEMFQLPFQKALDDYIGGKTSEREFLKASEYFKRWKFDWKLYRDIVLFARAWGVPVIALNAKAEVVDGVFSSGLGGLGPEGKREIPADMDFSDLDYKDRLREIFNLHEAGGDFDRFHQAQVLRDETMAHAIAGFMRENPGYQVVALAGGEHLLRGFGIPKRQKRLNGMDYAIVLNGMEPEESGADYFLFPEHMEPPAEVRLGVSVSEREGRVELTGIEPDGAGRKAGLKKGDALLSVDGWPISSVADVRTALFDKTKGDAVRMRVLRKGLFREKELELEAVF